MGLVLTHTVTPTHPPLSPHPLILAPSSPCTQVHTIGMDSKHAASARAALTLGKDMVFRDLAQGAFRMRGIGGGQTVTLLMIPEVRDLLQRQLSKAAMVPSSSLGTLSEHQKDLYAVTAWLVIAACQSESVQFAQSCKQSLATLWRSNCLDHVLSEQKQIAQVDSMAIVQALLQSFVTFEGVAVSPDETFNKKPVVLLFTQASRLTSIDEDDHPEHLSCMTILRSYSNIVSNQKATTIWVPTEATMAQTTFTTALASLGRGKIYAIPPSEVVRRDRLMSHFRVSANEESVVILSPGAKDVITTRGADILRKVKLFASLNNDLGALSSTRRMHCTRPLHTCKRTLTHIILPLSNLPTPRSLNRLVYAI